MRPCNRGLLPAWLALAAVLACAPTDQFFLDRQHRSNLALQIDELKQAQFYVSDEIVAHELGPSGTLEGPEHIIVIPLGTRGVVTDAGPHWLRVSFGPGDGITFVANPEAQPDSVYVLGTETEAGQPPVRVQGLPDRIVRMGSRRFRVIYGSDARLLIDTDDLGRLVEARAHAPGRDLK